jgi:hypothetical protein
MAATRTPAVNMAVAGSRDKERGEGMLSGREIGVGRFFSLENGGLLWVVE